MKTYPLQVQSYEDVWWSGCISPRICNLTTRWRWVVKFTTRPLYPWVKSPRCLLDRKLGGSQCWCGRDGYIL